jgi:hypothetical protein
MQVNEERGAESLSFGAQPRRHRALSTVFDAEDVELPAVLAPFPTHRASPPVVNADAATARGGRGTVSMRTPMPAGGLLASMSKLLVPGTAVFASGSGTKLRKPTPVAAESPSAAAVAQSTSALRLTAEASRTASLKSTVKPIAHRGLTLGRSYRDGEFSMRIGPSPAQLLALEQSDAAVTARIVQQQQRWHGSALPELTMSDVSDACSASSRSVV